MKFECWNCRKVSGDENSPGVGSMLCPPCLVQALRMRLEEKQFLSQEEIDQMIEERLGSQ